MGKLSSLSASEGATYKKRTIFYIAIKVEDNIKAVQCQLNWCSWQVYGLKICWQLQASAKKKSKHILCNCLTHFSSLWALSLSTSWQAGRTCPGRGPCVVSLRSNSPLSWYWKGSNTFHFKAAPGKGLRTLTRKAASMNSSLLWYQCSCHGKGFCSTWVKYSCIICYILLDLLDLSLSEQARALPGPRLA